MDDSVIDVMYGLRDYFYEVMYQFRLFLFGLNDSDFMLRQYKIWFFITIPLFFAAFEAIFDWLLPTFLDLRPMGVRRFFIPKLDSLKPIEAKSYKPVRSESFNSIRSAGFKSFRSNQKLTAAELKHFQILYQQKYNCTATPLQLRRFIYSEIKSYQSLDYHTGLTTSKVKGAVSGASSLGKGISKNVKGFNKWLHRNDNKEETAEEAAAELENN